MRTTLETEARAIRKLLALLVQAYCTEDRHGDERTNIVHSAINIDREADEENDRHIDGRDQF